MRFLSTLSLRRATNPKIRLSLTIMISIHALLAESDGGFAVGSWPHGIFLSTLSLRRATQDKHHPHHERAFLSTLSLRRATPAERHANSQQEFLSTLSLRRATEKSSSYSAYLEISIHALLAESDKGFFFMLLILSIFLSTLSLRRATPLELPFD